MTHTELDPLEDTETEGGRQASHQLLQPTPNSIRLRILKQFAKRAEVTHNVAHTELDPLEDTETQKG